MKGWGLALIATAAAIAVLGVGLVALVTSTSKTALLDLEVGECFVLPGSDGADAASGDVDVVATVDVVDCDEPHDAEVVGVGDLNPDGDLDYPPDQELFAIVDRRCAAVDDPPTDRFGVVPIAPTERSWSSLDGRFLCIAVPFGGGMVTGSIATA